jgi:hypothetical protein
MDKRNDYGDEEYNAKKDDGFEEEELKGADLEKLAKENAYTPTLLEDDNFDFVVSNP